MTFTMEYRNIHVERLTLLTVAQLAVCGGFLHALLFVEINPPPFVSDEPPLLLNADSVHVVLVNRQYILSLSLYYI